jgi:uncharacterized protein YecE (DUF72 family)
MGTAFWIGTSGYSYKEWKGSFYPDTLPDGEQLRHYAARFTSVEINYTFYRMPNVRLLQGWAKEVPEHFTFSLKAPRRITHDLRLRDAADIVADFCDTAQALKSKLGVLLVQLPPFLKRDLARLEDFLHQMPPGVRATVEFRNASWYADEVYDCLRRFGVALCIVDHPERPTPWEATADFGYFRLRQPDYTDEDLHACARRIQDLAGAWRDTFVYFKHEAEGRGPMLAAKLRPLLEGDHVPAAAGL